MNFVPRSSCIYDNLENETEYGLCKADFVFDHDIEIDNWLRIPEVLEPSALSMSHMGYLGFSFLHELQTHVNRSRRLRGQNYWEQHLGF